MRYKHPKVVVELELNTSEVEVVGFILNKGYGTSILLKLDGDGGTLELSSFIDCDADYPNWSSVEVEKSNELSDEELFDKLGLSEEKRLQDSSQYFENGEYIPF